MTLLPPHHERLSDFGVGRSPSLVPVVFLPGQYFGGEFHMEREDEATRAGHTLTGMVI